MSFESAPEVTKESEIARLKESFEQLTRDEIMAVLNSEYANERGIDPLDVAPTASDEVTPEEYNQIAEQVLATK